MLRIRRHRQLTGIAESPWGMFRRFRRNVSVRPPLSRWMKSDNRNSADINQEIHRPSDQQPPEVS